jgi:hypothetical protein
MAMCYFSNWCSMSVNPSIWLVSVVLANACDGLFAQDVPDPGPGVCVTCHDSPPSGDDYGGDNEVVQPPQESYQQPPPLPPNVHRDFWGRPTADWGYLFDNDDPNDYSVHPIQQGTPFENHPHVIWGGDGDVYAAMGWRWSVGSQNNYGFKNKYRVEPVPTGTPYNNWPHVVWAGDGVHVLAADGYQFVSRDPKASQDYSVEPIPGGTPFYNWLHVVWAGDGVHVLPQEGYQFVSMSPAASGNFRVQPLPAGTPFGTLPHVVWTGDGRHVQAAAGYEFVSKDPSESWDYGVRPLPAGTPFGTLPHVVYTGDGRHVQAAAGYEFVSKDPAVSRDYRVQPLPAGTPFRTLPHVVWTGDGGHVQAAAGFEFVSKDPAVSRDYRVQPLPAGTPFGTLPHVVWTGDGGHVQAAAGYEFVSKDPAVSRDYRVQHVPVPESEALSAKDQGPNNSKALDIGLLLAKQGINLKLLPDGPRILAEWGVNDGKGLLDDPRFLADLRIVQSMGKAALDHKLHDVLNAYNEHLDGLEIHQRAGEATKEEGNNVLKALGEINFANFGTDEDIRKWNTLLSATARDLFRKICDDPSLKTEGFRNNINTLIKGPPETADQ